MSQDVCVQQLQSALWAQPPFIRSLPDSNNHSHHTIKLLSNKYYIDENSNLFLKPPDIMANFLLVSNLKTVSCFQPRFSHSELVSTGHLLAKKTRHMAGWKKVFHFQIFWNLLWIYTLSLHLSNQHTKFDGHTLPCCRAVLPQHFESSVKRYPREILR